MTTGLDLHDAALALLQTIPHIQVYETTVPDNPPADTAGYVYPYLLVFPTPGHFPYPEAATLAAATGPELNWLLQVTAVGGTTRRCLQAAEAARAALNGQELVEFAGPLLEEQLNQTPLVDRDVTPPRIFLPMQFRCMTGA